MMTLLRALIFFSLLLGIGLVVDMGAQEPGSMTLRWYGYEIQTTAVFLALVAVVTVVFVYFFARLMAWLDTVPARLWQGRERKRQDQGFHYLLEGMDAIAAGDAKQARKLVDKAARLMPNQPVVHVLQAEAARREGDHATAINHYEHLTKSAPSSFLGLKGLVEEALHQNDIALAQKMLTQATALRPRSAWAIERTIQFAIAQGDIYKALETLPRLKRAEMTPEKQAFLAACTRHAQAQELFNNTQPEQALAALNKGIKACPNFVPLYLLGADILVAQGAEGRVVRMLVDGWQQCPHQSLFSRWLAHYGPDYGKEAVNQAQKLVRPLRDEMVGKLALAEVNIRARNFKVARDILAPLTETEPNKRIFALLAQVEEGIEPNSKAAHTWLKMALDAPDYIEPDGYIDAFRQWTGRFEDMAKTAALQVDALPDTQAPDRDVKFLPQG